MFNENSVFFIYQFFVYPFLILNSFKILSKNMERLKRSFRNSFRRKKSTHQTESSKPHQWDGDEIAVRNGNCSFPVKYLGCIQVQDSRGMHICEQALITLKAQKGKSIKGQLYVSGDGLRVVDDETKVYFLVLN